MRHAALVLGDPLVCELPALDVPKRLGHGITRGVGDDLRTRVVVAGRVRVVGAPDVGVPAPLAAEAPPDQRRA